MGAVVIVIQVSRTTSTSHLADALGKSKLTSVPRAFDDHEVITFDQLLEPFPDYFHLVLRVDLRGTQEEHE